MEFMLKDIWEAVVKLNFEFEGEEWKELQRREIAVLDISPSMGVAHSGYPIVCNEDEYWGVCMVDRSIAFKEDIGVTSGCKG